MIKNLEARAHRRRLDGVDLTFYRRSQISHLAQAVSDIVFEDVPEGGLWPDTPFALTDDQAQMLMDDLYRMGFRPSEQGDIEGVRAHLADMRKIAFHKLNIKE